MTLTDIYTEYETDLIDSLVDDGLDPDDAGLAHLFATVLWTFHWGRDGEEAHGTIGLVVEDGVLCLELETWVTDSDTLSPEIKPLSFTVPVDRFRLPEEQIRSMVHAHLCHEADERLWFGDDRPFHPHGEA